ncbi:MAG TPA: sigma-70 family RNA polymerase sigma factor [Flavitalea sp.]|nr:sigma-70 family RNA polymerase sigma factor [Flavitalea sp.]
MDRYAHLTDQDLLEKFYADLDNHWIGIVLQRYTLLLFGVSMKYLKNETEAQDAVQQIFLKAITELNKYKVEYFKSWLYMVCKNYCLMKIRDSQGKRSTEMRESMVLIAEENNTDHLLDKDRILDVMEVTLEELNAEQKDCIKLFYLEKQSYQEIAERTGFSLMQVKSYIQNGKRNLKILLEKKLRTE